MRELRDILEAFDAIVGAGERAVLASVVHVEGSTYRRPGARLLVGPDDAMVGLISGGCLEGDLLEHAQAVRASGAPKLVHYDATAEDDVVWGLGLGCAGVVDVLLECVDEASPGPLVWLRDWLSSGISGVIATCLAGPRLGARRALALGGVPQGALADARVDAALADALATGRIRKPMPSGDERVTIEIASAPLELAIFGAGPDAVPVARLASTLGWRVTLVDARPALAGPVAAERFPGAALRLADWEQAAAAAGVNAQTHALVMTHHYLHDRVVLPQLLDAGAPYIAVLGPKQRTEDLLADLGDGGRPILESERQRIFGPAGLDLGADAPEEIALSVIAEIQAVSRGRSGGWLRDRKGPIHEPPA